MVDENFPVRKKLRLNSFAYQAGQYYFVTVCTKQKEHLFGCVKNYKEQKNDETTPNKETVFVQLTPMGTIAQENILQIPNHFSGTRIEQFVVMPNHVHLLIFVKEPEKGEKEILLSPIIQSYKASVTRAAKRPVWQRSFYEHIIRNEKDYSEIYQYIENNPLKWYLRAGQCKKGIFPESVI